PPTTPDPSPRGAPPRPAALPGFYHAASTLSGGGRSAIRHHRPDDGVRSNVAVGRPPGHLLLLKTMGRKIFFAAGGTAARTNCPILLPLDSANQRLPSGPAAIPLGELSAVGIPNSLTLPVTVIRPMLFPSISVNQRLPSDAAVIP